MNLALRPDHPNIFFFAALRYGKTTSLRLAKNGYHVSEICPYGPVRDAVPYLIRRAEEILRLRVR